MNSVAATTSGETAPKEKRTARQVLDEYAEGRRKFRNLDLSGVELSGQNLEGASFYCSDLVGAKLTDCKLTHVQLKGADLRDAVLDGSLLNATDLIGADFSGASLSGVDLTGAALARATLSHADLSGSHLGSTQFSECDTEGIVLREATLAHTHFCNQDVTKFCQERSLVHTAPSYIDAGAVIRSHKCDSLHDFMLACGVPEVFATYMIDCAKATSGDLLRSLLQTTFISFGGPDEAFARRLYDSLKKHGISSFFFPETARFGARLGDEVYRGLQEHDRVILICSRDSLNRKGVLNEIRETLAREARDGGASYLLPITLDDYIFNEWVKVEPELARRVSDRVVGDFRLARESEAPFNRALSRLVDALKKKRPGVSSA